VPGAGQCRPLPGMASGLTRPGANEGAQPNRPVMYSSVRLLVGLVKKLSVVPNSTSSPRNMKAVNRTRATPAACCGYDHDCIFIGKLIDQLFNFRGGHRIECGTRLIEQNHVGTGCHRAGNAKALLLAAREAQPRFLKLVLHFTPQRGALERVFDATIQVGFS